MFQLKKTRQNFRKKKLNKKCLSFKGVSLHFQNLVGVAGKGMNNPQCIWSFTIYKANLYLLSYLLISSKNF